MTDWRESDLTGSSAFAASTHAPDPQTGAWPDPANLDGRSTSAPGGPDLSAAWPDEPGPLSTSTSAPRPRSGWPKVAVGALLVLMVGAAAGAGGTYLAMNPGRDRLRDQTSSLQAQLDTSQVDLSTAEGDRDAARRVTASCQALVVDSAALVDQWDRLDEMFANPELDTVAPGSPREDELYGQIDSLVAEIERTQVKVQVDGANCDTRPT